MKAKTKTSYDKLYKVRKHFVINNGDGVHLDPDLKPIVFNLPEPPKNWKNIKNYGLHPDDQIYHTDDVPPRLARLEQDIIEEFQENASRSRNNSITGYKLHREFWTRLSAQAELYEKEI